ncbi:hypothetical protein Pmani_027279 [Petrolisthes manimaculis]|uniref:Uncharacterized protein n=1 Tax=Petrolisthes manimaculis TaxID=1843537 RepID=A0AAE1P3B0_9EUCA|nr:hypothetical protein Pmani_027279 [Petrolisthes manimaculis]
MQSICLSPLVIEVRGVTEVLPGTGKRKGTSVRDFPLIHLGRDAEPGTTPPTRGFPTRTRARRPGVALSASGGSPPTLVYQHFNSATNSLGRLGS